MNRIRSHLSFANVVSVIALFVAISGGTAVALNGQNTVQSDDLGPGAQVKAPDVAANAVNGSDVVGNSLTGTDVNESSLGRVPSALLGGYGRWTGGEFCNPNTPTFTACAVTTLNLPAGARVLVTAQAQAEINSGDVGAGNCHIGTTSGPLLNSEEAVLMTGDAFSENLSLVGITPPLPAGQRSFGIDCNQTLSDIAYNSVGVAAVAISPG